MRLWLEGEPTYVAERNKRIQAVRKDDVGRVARDILDPGRLSLTIVGRLP